ncbi:hypothetical protein MSBR2_3097 [Methanosarcina barkeri 227]|uniref:Uncharacterized protein n=1 Tax=Methanosarcina barkeri 227 TaxID=1434106 RepID=A0A0E3R7C7_METBA|nr:hypothetical protein MSBR2_3097 [Methanosarcina barkeri 227]
MFEKTLFFRLFSVLPVIFGSSGYFRFFRLFSESIPFLASIFSSNSAAHSGGLFLGIPLKFILRNLWVLKVKERLSK